jgi:hypothetical protein
VACAGLRKLLRFEAGSAVCERTVMEELSKEHTRQLRRTSSCQAGM